MTEAETVKRIDAGITRIMTEHLQMLVVLESCCLYFKTLGTLGGLQATQSETCLQQSKKIEALLERIKTP